MESVVFVRPDGLGSMFSAEIYKSEGRQAMPPTCHVLQVRIASVMTCHDKCSTLNSCESALPYLPWQDLLGLVPCPSARSLSRSCCKMPAGFHGRFKCLYIWNAWYAATTSQISQFTALFQTSKPVNFEVSSDCTNLFGCRMCTL